MEHRLGARRPVMVNVVLYPHDAPAVLAHTRDVSISGMFVEASAQMLSAHGVMDVEMTLPVATGLRTFRWQAMVIRRTASGAGLMFDRLRPPAITRLLANLDSGLPNGESIALPGKLTERRGASVAASPRATTTRSAP
jgi:hypothetical protein